MTKIYKLSSSSCLSNWTNFKWGLGALMIRTKWGLFHRKGPHEDLGPHWGPEGRLGIHIYSLVYIHIFSPMYIHICSPVYIHICSPVYIHICSPVYINICSPVYIHICSPVYIYISAAQYIYTPLICRLYLAASDLERAAYRTVTAKWFLIYDWHMTGAVPYVLHYPYFAVCTAWSIQCSRHCKTNSVHDAA